jgi:hypothetical protein
MALSTIVCLKECYQGVSDLAARGQRLRVIRGIRHLQPEVGLGRSIQLCVNDVEHLQADRQTRNSVSSAQLL